VTRRRGRRRKQLLDRFKEKGGYWKLKEEALDRTLQGTGFSNVYGPLERQMSDVMLHSLHSVLTLFGSGLQKPA